MKLAWTVEALNDRRAIFDFLERRNIRAAGELDERFSTLATRLRDHPSIGRPGRVAGTREVVAHRNYVIVYDVVDGTVRILRVLHTARMWPPAALAPRP